MQLFNENAGWKTAAKSVSVFELFGEWIYGPATDEQLRQVVSDLQRRGIAIAVQVGPLTATTCGKNIEGFSGLYQGKQIAARIKQAGGAIDYIVYDEPYFHASLYDGPGACHWPAERVATEILEFENAIRAIFPNVVFGSAEPLPTSPHLPAAYLQTWLEAYRRVTGKPLAFLHLDTDFVREDWPQSALELERIARAQGVKFGIFYLGNWSDTSDKDWIRHAGERIRLYEVTAGGRPDHAVFESWEDHPDYNLPETTPYTFTWLINRYVSHKAGMGVKTVEQGANLAYKKALTVSRTTGDNPPWRAVDENSNTWWGSGGQAPQWVEIDLGSPHTIGEIRLLTSQDPAGATVHRVMVKGPNVQDQYYLLYTFSGVTSDNMRLIYTLSAPLPGIRYVRIDTLSSPSWVSWREIEVIAGQ